MKISDLKQPYRRMAEYYRIVERSELTGRIEIYIPDEFPTPDFNNWFWTEIKKGKHPEITEEIKEHFPSDFDFSSEEESLNQKYTQLAKEGKFDELPDTCEFSEPVELEVWDEEIDREILEISGKYKGFYIFFDNEDDADELGVVICTYKHAQLPTPKIDFSEFKTGDVVEVDAFGLYYGYLESNKEDYIQLSFSSFSTSTRRILKKDIKSITKLK